MVCSLVRVVNRIRKTFELDPSLGSIIRDSHSESSGYRNYVPNFNRPSEMTDYPLEAGIRTRIRELSVVEYLLNMN